MELSGTKSCLVDKIWPPEIDRHGGSTFGSASSGRPPAPLDLWVRVLVERIAGTTAAPAARRGRRHDLVTHQLRHVRDASPGSPCRRRLRAGENRLPQRA